MADKKEIEIKIISDNKNQYVKNSVEKKMATVEQLEAAREKYGKPVAPVKKPITIVRAKTEKDVTGAMQKGTQFIFVESDPYKSE